MLHSRMMRLCEQERYSHFFQTVDQNIVRQKDINPHPLEHIRELPPGVAYMPKPWQPLNVLIAAEQASAPARHS